MTEGERQYNQNQANVAMQTLATAVMRVSRGSAHWTDLLMQRLAFDMLNMPGVDSQEAIEGIRIPGKWSGEGPDEPDDGDIIGSLRWYKHQIILASLHVAGEWHQGGTIQFNKGNRDLTDLMLGFHRDRCDAIRQRGQRVVWEAAQ